MTQAQYMKHYMAAVDSWCEASRVARSDGERVEADAWFAGTIRALGDTPRAPAPSRFNTPRPGSLMRIVDSHGAVIERSAEG